MKSNYIKKLIASTLVMSFIFGASAMVTQNPIVVQADDDDRYDDLNDRYDDDRYDNDYNKVPVTTNKTAITEYIKNVYKNIFGREVDQQGLNFWVNTLASGQVELDDYFKRLLVEAEFRGVAPTVQDKIKKIYQGVFQREPDQNGLNFWVARYNAELRDEGNEREALEEIIEEMTDGAEFKQILNKLGIRDDD